MKMKKILIIIGIALLVFVYISENKEVSNTEYHHIESVKFDIQKIKTKAQYSLINADLRELDSRNLNNILNTIILISKDGKVTYKEYELFKEHISNSFDDQNK